MMIPSEVLDMLQSGLPLVIGTCDEGRMPETATGWGLRLDPGGTPGRMTIFLDSTTSQRTVSNLSANGRIAVTVARPVDEHAAQMKGRALAIRAPTQEERKSQKEWYAGCIAQMISVGIPPKVANALSPGDLLAVDIEISEVYSQTPGPGAGKRL